MAQNIGTLISASIRPNDSLDPIASAFANEVKGGLHGYATISERNSIIVERRDWGMFVVVYNDASPSNNKTYQLTYGYFNTDISNNLNWKEFTSSSGSTSGGTEWLNSVISVSYAQPATPSTTDRYLVGLKPGDSISGSVWGLNSSGFISEYNLNLSTWDIISPTQGMTVRVDNEPNHIYSYRGVYPSGQWSAEKISQIFQIDPITTSGVTYSVGTTPSFTSYSKDIIFLTKFVTTNSATSSLTLNVNNIGATPIKKATSIGLIDLEASEIIPNITYSLTYDGTNFQIVKPFGQGSGFNDGDYVNYYIPVNDEITVQQYEQYWVYGDLTIDGELINYGQVIIANGNMILGTAGTFSNYGELHLIEIGSESSFVEYIEVTKAELDVLITNLNLEVGAKYKVTGVDVALYGGTDIYVDALLPNKISESGSGVFYTPKYDVSADNTGYDIWTKYMDGSITSIVGTFSLNEVVTSNNGATATYITNGILEYGGGNWNVSTSITGNLSGATASISGFISPTYSIASKVHWGGKTWENINGNIGDSVDKYTLNSEWNEIEFNSFDYNIHIDEIQYDYINDMIIYRKDKYNNVVSGSQQVFTELQDVNGYGLGNPIKDFQWGCMEDTFDTINYFNLGIQGNKVINSYFETLNNRASYIWFNELNNVSYINNNIFNTYGFLFENYLNNSRIVDNNVSYGGFASNILNANSHISNNNLSTGNINNNEMFNSSISNSINLNSFIESNIMNYCQIINNKLKSTSYTRFNSLEYCKIDSNILISSKIEFNKISGNDMSNIGIESNTLDSNSAIISNKFYGDSKISNNILSGGIIRTNILDNGQIRFNTLNSSSISSNNILFGAINSNLLSSSFININVLNNSDINLSLSGTLSSKTINNLNINGIGVVLYPNISTASVLFAATYSRTIIKRQDGTLRITYVDNSDVTIIVPITT